MHSDSELEAYDEYDFATSSDEPSAEEVVEMQVEEYNNKMSLAFQSYAWIFEDDDGFFKANFPHLIPNSCIQCDRWDSNRSPDCFHAVPAILSVFADVDATATSSAATPVRLTEETAATAKEGDASVSDGNAAAVGLQPSGVYILSAAKGKPTPTSRFLCDNFTSCILIPVDKSSSRATLRRAHADLFRDVPGVPDDGLDIVPGYNYSVSSGWALPISIDAGVLATLKSLYPSWRAATPADVPSFTKPRCKMRNEGAPPTPPPKSWTRNTAKLMRSKERFLNCVEAAGGWSNVVFVAMDVEAFMVAADSVPLPAEFAFVPIRAPRRRRRLAQVPSTVTTADETTTTTTAAAVAAQQQQQRQTSDKIPRVLHFFCHPGYVPISAEATVMHTCLETHLIPYRNATFLEHDYRTKVRQIDTGFVRNPRVVMINKGAPESPTLMDVQAIRWLHAVAVWQKLHYCDVSHITKEVLTDRQLWVPDAEDIHCFDVSVLEAAAADCAERKNDIALKNGETTTQADTAAVEAQKPQCCCTYHAVVEKSNVMEGAVVHCAKRDAQVLAQRIRAALAKWRPGRSA